MFQILMSKARRVRLPALLRAALGGSLLAVVGLLATAAAASPPARYYVSLGDSLAIGMQPGPNGHDRATTQGYADDVARRLGRAQPELRLVKLGCAGETSATMVGGGGCAYGSGSQLDQAVAFLRSHRGAISLITINIGDNDVEECFNASSGVLDTKCAANGLDAIDANLPQIVARLRAAAGRHVAIVGITDYDQFLAYWLRGAQGRHVARASVGYVTYLNGAVDSIYWRAGAIVADAAPAFATTDLRHRTRLAGHGRVPRAVASVCRLTWACASTRADIDDHANGAGYRVLAGTIERALIRTHPHFFSPSPRR